MQDETYYLWYDNEIFVVRFYADGWIEDRYSTLIDNDDTKFNTVVDWTNSFDHKLVKEVRVLTQEEAFIESI